MRLSPAGTTLLAALAAVLSVPAARGADPEQPRPVLRSSIVGTSSCDTRPCFSGVMRSAAVQSLLLRLAAGPLDDAAAAESLPAGGPSAGDLLALRLVRRDGGRIVLNFALFTAADLAWIRDVSETRAASLAAALLARRPEIDATLAAYDLPGVDRGEVAFFLLGCASLDWDGLAVTADKGYRATTSERPDGTYVPAAQEITGLSLQRIYWGSHNARFDGIGLSSFGDHHALPRMLLPDLLWRAPDFPASIPEAPRNAMDAFLAASLRHGAGVLARTMVALRDGGRSAAELAAATGADEDETAATLGVLRSLGYVSGADGRFSARVPILAPRDEAMARRVLAIGRQTMESWLAASFAGIRSDLQDLSFTRSGVPFEEGFTMVWHYIFGMTNQKLVEAGLFADPYAPGRRHPGAICVVNALDL